MKENKPLFLLLLGVEGAGHHMLMAFLKHFFNSQKVVQHGSWHPYFFNRWDAQKTIQKQQAVKIQSYSALKNEIDRLMFASQATLMYSGVSFPYGAERDTLRRPDIIDMVELLGDHVEFRPLIIYRDPVSCAYSALRRGFNNNVLHQARIVEDNLLYIKQQLQACDIGYRSISFENFLSSPSAYEVGLKHWWALSDESFNAGKKEIRKPTSKKDIPSSNVEQLSRFFSPLRTRQWDAFLERCEMTSMPEYCA